MTIKNLYPTIKPSLDLNFARSKTLDPKVTFSRASTAAYYDGKTVAKAEENLLTYSQDFSNVVWAKDGVAVSPNAGISPDGSQSASKVIAFANATDHGIVQTIQSGYTYAISIYAKAAEHSKIQFYDGGYARIKATFDLSAVTASGDIACTVSITSVGSGWYRCVAISTNTSLSSFRIKSLPSSGVTTSTFGDAYTGDGSSGVYLWGAQLEQRSSATAYTPTTSAPITNYLPALQYAAAGVPRFDHDPITGESKGLLIEESRTNLLTYSSDFGNAAGWSKVGVSITSDNMIAPDGTQTADKIAETATNDNHWVYVTPGSTGSLTLTVYAKAGERSWLSLRATGASGISFAFFNLITGSIGSVGSGLSASIQDVGNGWYRCAITTTLSTATPFVIGVSNADNSTFYQGSVNYGIYIWGAQLEAGAFPTSYIPTTSAQVTRAADSASMTGANFSSWYRQDEGAVLAEVNVPFALSYTSRLLTIDDGTSNNILQCQYNGSAQMTFALDVAGSNRFAVSKSGMTFGSTHKLAGAYQTGNSIFGSDGANASGSAATVAGFAPTTLRIGSAPGATLQPNGYIKRIAYYPKRLTDAQLQALTV